MSDEKMYWDVLPSARIGEIFQRIIAPRCAGFLMLRNFILTKQISEDLVHLIKLTQYKGGVYGFEWGVSLPYVPHQWKNQLRWHRSAKSARFDLWEQAGPDMDDPSVLALHRDHEIFYANFMHGEGRFESDLQTAWSILHVTVFSWLNRITNLQDVLLLSERQATKIWHGPGHWPPPRLVYAFTLARLGSMDKAIGELAAIARQDEFDPQNNLRRGLKTIALTCQLCTSRGS